VYKAQFSLHFAHIILPVTILLLSCQSMATDTDPTGPFGVSGSGNNGSLLPNGGFQLTSIIHGDGIHTAVINGKIYKMFDYVGEYRITAINSHSVIMRSKKKRLKIDIFKHQDFKSNVVENTVAN
jgi:MSHA biogenesis protein MshK